VLLDERGEIMWGEILCIVLGGALVLGASLGKKFYAGMSPRSRVPIPAWQGRAWLLMSGGLLLSAGLGGVLGPSHAGMRHFVERAFVSFDFGYEMFGGIVATLVGVVFLVPGKEKVDIQAKLLGAGLVFFGIILISDSVWKMRIR
jgi:hypothetical protein